MKDITIYKSDFENLQDWNDFLEELEYSLDEKETIEEVDLNVQSSIVQNIGMEEKQY